MPHFNGADYQPRRDDARLAAQMRRIKDFMADGQHWTLDEIRMFTGDPQTSISTCLRHLRKPRFGGHTVNKEYLGRGLYRYWVVPNGGPPCLD